MLELLYYPRGTYGPVAVYLEQLAKEQPKAFAKLAIDLEVLGAEGLRSSRITIRPMGKKLWELKRLYEGVQYRIFFGIWKGAAWLLHSIEKKSAQTPNEDLELARKRLREVVSS